MSKVSVGDNVIVYGWTNYPAIVLRQIDEAFLIQYLGEDGNPRGAVLWHHESHLRLSKKDCRVGLKTQCRAWLLFVFLKNLWYDI